MVLVNFLFGTTKLAIWKTRNYQMLSQGWTDVVQSPKGLVAACLSIEHAFYSLTNNLIGRRFVLLFDEGVDCVSLSGFIEGLLKVKVSISFCLYLSV